MLRDAVRQRSTADAEGTFAALAAARPRTPSTTCLSPSQDAAEVHRVVLPYRCWDLMGIIGREQAHTLLAAVGALSASRRDAELRASLGQGAYPGAAACSINIDCSAAPWARAGRRRLGRGTEPDHLPRLRPKQAADAAAAAWPRGLPRLPWPKPSPWPPINSCCATMAGRQIRPGQSPAGSVHGDSIGVHACDSANAWRNLARVGNARNKVVCLILGAWQVARDRGDRGGDFLNWQPYPPHRSPHGGSGTDTATRLLGALDEAIRGRDQARASCGGPPLCRAERAGSASLGFVVALRHQRGWGAARGEILPHRGRGIRRRPARFPLAPFDRPGARHRQRYRPGGSGLCPGVSIAWGLTPRHQRQRSEGWDLWDL